MYNIYSAWFLDIRISTCYVIVNRESILKVVKLLARDLLRKFWSAEKIGLEPKILVRVGPILLKKLVRV